MTVYALDVDRDSNSRLSGRRLKTSKRVMVLVTLQSPQADDLS